MRNSSFLEETARAERIHKEAGHSEKAAGLAAQLLLSFSIYLTDSVDGKRCLGIGSRCMVVISGSKAQ